jgi:hypothetical protein
MFTKRYKEEAWVREDGRNEQSEHIRAQRENKREEDRRRRRFF